MYVASSQVGVAPVHAPAAAAVQRTHWPAFGPAVAHAGKGLLQAAPLSKALHGRHAGGAALPSQTGICATQPPAKLDQFVATV